MITAQLKYSLTLLSCRWTAAFVRDDKPEGDQRRFMNQFAAVSANPSCYEKMPLKSSFINAILI